jgi:UDP-glucose 4-epimerase
MNAGMATNQSDFSDKTVLITGGTGSFGNAMVKRLRALDIREIRVFSRDEKKQDDMRKALQDDRVKFYIGDVRDRDSIRDAVQGVDFLFHAAALKQVPSCEFFPMEAVRTNVIGTDNVLTEAIAAKIRKIVCLSTDKAAYPINAMGTSKAMMEKVIIAKSRTVDEDVTTICCTRYGNVMASRGSVIPLFLKQALANEPLTITDPNMTRFLMSLEEATELVLFAFAHAKQGDLLVQKAPAATIDTLAKAVIQYANSSSEVRFIGTRHGEKLHETLLTLEERARSVDLGEYFQVTPDGRDLNYTLYFDRGDQTQVGLTEYTSENTHRLDELGVIDKLRSIELRPAD